MTKKNIGQKKDGGEKLILLKTFQGNGLPIGTTNCLVFSRLQGNGERLYSRSSLFMFNVIIL